MELISPLEKCIESVLMMLPDGVSAYLQMDVLTMGIMNTCMIYYDRGNALVLTSKPAETQLSTWLT